MWLHAGIQPGWRKRQYEYCLDIVQEFRRQHERNITFMDAFQNHDGKIGSIESPWHASRARLAAMISQVAKGPLEQWFAPVDAEEFMARVGRVDRRKSHSNPFGRKA